MRLMRLLLLLLGLGAAPLSGAWAHAALVESEPVDGGSLAAAPAMLVLRFDEAITLLELRLTGPGGGIALPGASEAADGTIRAALPQALRPGTYLASYRIISADGHPVSGGIVFGIGMAPDRAATPATAGADWNLPAELLRFLLYLGLALGAGGALFRALVAPLPAGLWRWLAGGAWLGVAAALLGIGVQGGGMQGAPSFLALLDGATWEAAAGSTVFTRETTVALGLAVVGLSWNARGAAAGLAGALLAAIGLGFSGHAAAGGVLAQALLVVHALAAIFWLGAFLPLAALLRGRGGEAAGAVRRFATIAMPAVALLLLSGAGQAAWHLGGFSSLLSTRYGLLVLAKAIGALLLLALAAWNHWRLTPRLGRAGAAASLLRSIAAEGTLAVLLLGFTAMLSMTPPPAVPRGHEHMAEAAPGMVVATEAQGLSITVEAEPARAGPNRITLHVARPDGTPLAAPEAWLELAQPQAGVAGIRRQMRPEGPGRFVQEGPELALPGTWSLRVEILVDDFEQVSTSLSLPVAP